MTTFKLLCRTIIPNTTCILRGIQRTYSSQNRNILTLHDRGIFQNIFPNEKSADLYRALVSKSQCFYCGFDPTADSLHVGNLLAIMALLHCQRAGHDIIALIGTATAQIGDPSGKSKERPAMHQDTVRNNADSLAESLQRIFRNHQEYFWRDGDLKPARIIENQEWYSQINIIDFLSTVGRHFRMGTMLGRESVQGRLQSPEGMSLTEFTYQTFQAYDWLHIYNKYRCLVQIGGNDQIGNIMSGYDLIQRIHNKPVFGLTVPIITSTAGDKLGKTAGNAVWLNGNRTTPFDLYQYFVRLPDADVESYLKLFTFLSDDKISSIVSENKTNPKARKAQMILGENVTKLVHGEDGLALALRCTKALYNSSLDDLIQLSEQELGELFQGATACEMLLEPGTAVIDVLMKAKCFGRIVDAERVIRAGGVSINHQKVTNTEMVLIPGQHILPNHTSLVRVGKKHYYLIKWLGLG